MASVYLKNVSKSFDGKSYVVNNLSLSIDDGDFLVILGPSGCGKTTLLNMIAGLEKPSSGEIYIDGCLANNLSPRDRNIAMVFQNHALYPHLTVYKNLAFPLKMRHIHKKLIDEKVNKVAGLLSLKELLDRKPNQLSGGQQQRVAIGKALISNPKVYLMDEPFSNLDTSLKSMMRTEIKKLHQEIKSTFIYVTHDQIEAMTLGNKIAIINNGCIQQLGSPFDVFSYPGNEFVARFIGNYQMNFLPSVANNGKIKFLNFEINIADKSDYTPVIIGIRPEDISTSVSEENSFFITNINILGSDMELKGFITDHNLDLKLNILTKTDLRYKEKTTIRIGVLSNRIHIFDANSKKRIKIISIKEF